MVTYKQLLPAASLMMIASCSFLLGTFFANWPYDYYTLWAPQSEEYFAKALAHYKFLATQPNLILYTLLGITTFGFVGALIKIFMPSEDTKYFEYGSLVAIVAAVCIYLTNVRNGEMAALYDDWGDVTPNMGVSVIAASQVMIVVVLLGVVVLQCGLFYAEYADYTAKTEFYLKELGEKYNEKTAAPAEEAKPAKKDKAKASGASTKQTTAKSRKA